MGARVGHGSTLRRARVRADTRDVRSPRHTSLQMSWVATALAGLLTVTTPVAAGLMKHAEEGGARHVAIRATADRGTFTTPSETRVLGAPVVGGAGASAVDRPAKPEPFLMVHARPGLVAHRRPWASSPEIATVATVSKYYRVPLVLWVEEVSHNGDWGRIELPYVWPRREGWIRLEGLERETTWVRVDVDLSEHTVRVFKRGDLLFRSPGATGAAASPTPPGDYVVTDRVPFSAGSYLGSFAFGISGIQPRLPAGWTGGNQLAIHGTNTPATIGQSVSAGCIRVSESTLDRLLPLLRLGTPVQIHA
jgi:hypothetical protein